MGEPTGLVSGFAVHAVSLSIQEIVRHINIARRCRKELESLRSVLTTLQHINSDLHKYRVAVNSGRFNPSANFTPLSLNKWHTELDMLLHQADDMVQRCSAMRKFNVISRYAMSKNISGIFATIEKHINYAPLIQLVQSLGQIQSMGEVPASGSSVHVMKGSMYIEEPLVVGQEMALHRIEQLVMHNTLRIGVVGIGGLGKTLLLKRLFNNMESFFSNDLMLWVTVSSKPSFPALRIELYKQISFKVNEVPERPKDASEEDIKIWLYKKLSEKKFTMILDDVWEMSASHLLEELCVPPLHSADAKHNNVIIVSSRSRRALLQMGIPTSSPAIVDMQSLMEDDSWKLFSSHAFPYNNGALPPFINEEVARSVCKECGGLPLAIKVIGRTVSAVTNLQEWESTLRRLQTAQSISSGGRGLEEFPDFGAHFRISLLGNKLSSIPNSLRGPHIRSLILNGNINLKGIPRKVIASMTSLQNLDLSRTSLQSLPKSIGRLKHLICLRLQGVPIKRLPNSVTSLNMLQILDLYKSSIRELPPSIQRLSSLRLLNISECKELQCIPHGISKLTSLEALSFKSICSPRASINDLNALKHLKLLLLFNNGETIQHGTLGNMVDMESLSLRLTMMESLPQDITAMSKLRVLYLNCPDLTAVEHSFCSFQQLGTLTLMGCEVLKELPDLHKLVSLKQLNILNCPQIKELPKEYGECGAFPKLEVLNLMWLDKLGELPQVDEAAIPSLKTLSIVGCESLKMLAEGYWNLKSMKKIGIYGCSMVLQKLQEEGNAMERNRAVQTITMSLADTQAFCVKHNDMLEGHVHMEWGEFWFNDFFQTLSAVCVNYVPSCW